jgi:hypothetical protein
MPGGEGDLEYGTIEKFKTGFDTHDLPPKKRPHEQNGHDRLIGRIPSRQIAVDVSITILPIARVAVKANGMERMARNLLDIVGHTKLIRDAAGADGLRLIGKLHPAQSRNEGIADFCDPGGIRPPLGHDSDGFGELPHADARIKVEGFFKNF